VQYGLIAEEVAEVYSDLVIRLKPSTAYNGPSTVADKKKEILT
jgi:hypothetical protein